MDAVKELASKPAWKFPAPIRATAEQAERRAGLHDVMASAQEWFKNNLLGDEGRKAREYLTSRGFDGHTIERFGFGYAPEGRNALKKALTQYPENRCWSRPACSSRSTTRNPTTASAAG